MSPVARTLAPELNARVTLSQRSEGRRVRPPETLIGGLASWTESDVYSWIIENESDEMQKYAEQFKKNNVDGAVLDATTMQQLEREYRIKSVGHRHKIMDLIKRLAFPSAHNQKRGSLLTRMCWWFVTGPAKMPCTHSLHEDQLGWFLVPGRLPARYASLESHGRWSQTTAKAGRRPSRILSQTGSTNSHTGQLHFHRHRNVHCWQVPA